jgi:hypothetical protein
MTTPFNTRCDILGELWVRYKNSPDFYDFITYNDLGLPLAYSISSGIVKQSSKAEMFVSETWDILLSALDMEDTGFESLDAVLGDEFPNMGLLDDEG